MGDSDPHPGEIPPKILSPAGLFSPKGAWRNWKGSGERTSGRPGAKAHDLQGEVRELGLFGLEKRLRDDLVAAYDYPWGSCRDMDLNSSY